MIHVHSSPAGKARESRRLCYASTCALFVFSLAPATFAVSDGQAAQAAQAAQVTQARQAVQVASAAPVTSATRDFRGGKGALARPGAPPIVNKPQDPMNPGTFAEQLIDEAKLSNHTTASLLLLHTNDIHDIIKAPTGPTALGGTPYISAYVHQQKASRPDVLVLNAGDMLEKGDKVGVVSKGEVSFAALAATGVDCICPGNHDFKYSGETFIKNTKLAGLTVICAGLLYEDTKKPVFKETFEKKIGNVRVGIIGACIARNYAYNKQRKITGLANEELGARINELAKEMEPRVDLTVLLLHNGLYAGRFLARKAPMVDIVVCGHSNEVTEKPEKTTDTQALVVEVGRAGQWVGSLDLTVDCDANKVAKYAFHMVPMNHAKIEPDEALTRKIAEWEKKLMPQGGGTEAAAPTNVGPETEDANQ